MYFLFLFLFPSNNLFEGDAIIVDQKHAPSLFFFLFLFVTLFTLQLQWQLPNPRNPDRSLDLLFPLSSFPSPPSSYCSSSVHSVPALASRSLPHTPSCFLVNLPNPSSGILSMKSICIGAIELIALGSTAILAKVWVIKNPAWDVPWKKQCS